MIIKYQQIVTPLNRCRGMLRYNMVETRSTPLSQPQQYNSRTTLLYARLPLVAAWLRQHNKGFIRSTFRVNSKTFIAAVGIYIMQLHNDLS